MLEVESEVNPAVLQVFLEVLYAGKYMKTSGALTSACDLSCVRAHRSTPTDPLGQVFSLLEACGVLMAPSEDPKTWWLTVGFWCDVMVLLRGQ